MSETLYMWDTGWADTRFYAGGQWINFNLDDCGLCRVPTEEGEPPEIQIALNRVGRQGFTESLWNSGGIPIFR